MATKGTRGTAIAFGSFEISVSLKKAKTSRDLKTEYVNEAGEKVTMSGGAGGSRTPAPGVEKAVRITAEHVVRLPAEELARIEQESKDQWAQMQVLEVIDYRQVPTERIEGSYWLQPAKGSVVGLALLAHALRETGGVAVVKWCSSSREKLGVIRPRIIGRGSAQKVALLLSEVTFANDFLAPDEDALAINEVMDSLDPRACATACSLLDAFSRDDAPMIDTATDSAVDARLALLERLQDEQTTAALEASLAGLTLRNVITGSVTWADDVEQALAAAGVDPAALATPEQLERAKDRDFDLRGADRAVWIATGERPDGGDVVSLEKARAAA